MKTRKIFFSVLTLVLGLLLATGTTSCKKDFELEPQAQEQNQVINPTASTVNLNFGGSKGIVNSGDTISGDSLYYFCFWLTPATGNNIAVGTFTIHNSSQVVMYQSVSPENGISWKAPLSGYYTMGVSGVYNNIPFSFVNITIYVTGGIIPPSPTPTSPVRLYNFQVSQSTAAVDVAISKSQYINQSGASWFHLFRIDGQNFLTNQTVISEPDSVRFTLSFPNTNGLYVDFNAAYVDGSSGGMWLNPSAGNPPSILWTGSQNIPHTSSGSYFGFRLHSVVGGYELRTHSGILLLSTVSIPNPIPGNSGDGVANNYQLRWSGYTHYFKTAVTAPTFRYKIGMTGVWTYLPTQQLVSNSDYFETEIPAGTVGQLRFQWGTGIGTGFTPATLEMGNSQYYESSTDQLVKTI